MSDYETLRQQHLGQFFGVMLELAQHLSWPREQIEQEQTRRLRRTVTAARDKSAWHRQRLAHVDVQTLTAADLPSLPVMTKDDLMTHWNEIVTDPRLNLDLVNRHLETITRDAYLLESYHAIASGGSSGRRGVFVWDWDGWATAYAALVRWPFRYAANGPTVPAGAQSTIASVAADSPTHMTSAMTQTFATPVAPVLRFPVTMPLHQIVAGLNAVQPNSLTGYSSALFELAREAKQGRLTIAPRTVTFTGEPLSPEMRAAVEEAWRVPVGGSWGTSEGCVVGQSCFLDTGMHLAEDVLIVEPVDHDGAAVPVGEISAKIYLTNLMNQALPLIRYEITDSVRVLAEPCACGSTFARVDDIQGRVEDILRYDNGVSVFPHVFGSVLSRQPQIIEYQVRQTPKGADVLVRAVDEVDLDALASRITAQVEKAGLPGPEVTISRVATIERTSAGKLKRYVPL